MRTDGELELAARDPGVAPALDILAARIDLVGAGLEQLVGADQHRVVLLQGELGDRLGARQHRSLVVFDLAARRDELRSMHADLGAHVDRDVLQAVLCLPQVCLDARDVGVGNFKAGKLTAQTYGTLPAFTPPTSFTASLGPIASTY